MKKISDKTLHDLQTVENFVNAMAKAFLSADQHEVIRMKLHASKLQAIRRHIESKQAKFVCDDCEEGQCEYVVNCHNQEDARKQEPPDYCPFRAGFKAPWKKVPPQTEEIANE